MWRSKKRKYCDDLVNDLECWVRKFTRFNTESKIIYIARIVTFPITLFPTISIIITSINGDFIKISSGRKITMRGISSAHGYENTDLISVFSNPSFDDIKSILETWILSEVSIYERSQLGFSDTNLETIDDLTLDIKDSPLVSLVKIGVVNNCLSIEISIIDGELTKDNLMMYSNLYSSVHRLLGTAESMFGYVSTLDAGFDSIDIEFRLP